MRLFPLILWLFSLTLWLFPLIRWLLTLIWWLFSLIRWLFTLYCDSFPTRPTVFSCALTCINWNCDCVLLYWDCFLLHFDHFLLHCNCFLLYLSLFALVCDHFPCTVLFSPVLQLLFSCTVKLLLGDRQANNLDDVDQANGVGHRKWLVNKLPNVRPIIFTNVGPSYSAKCMAPSSAFVHWSVMRNNAVGWPSDSNFGQNWKHRKGEIPLLLLNHPKWSIRCMNHRSSTHHFAFDKPVELHWWNMWKVIGFEPWAKHPNHSTTDLHAWYKYATCLKNRHINVHDKTRTNSFLSQLEIQSTMSSQDAQNLQPWGRKSGQIELKSSSNSLATRWQCTLLRQTVHLRMQKTTGGHCSIGTTLDHEPVFTIIGLQIFCKQIMQYVWQILVGTNPRSDHARTGPNHPIHNWKCKILGQTEPAASTSFTYKWEACSILRPIE
jgi:hypothetical protein